MYKPTSVVIMVVCMAIWPFSNGSSTQDGEGGGSSFGGLSGRIGALERQIDRLEDKIGRLEKRMENAEVGGNGASRKRREDAGGNAANGNDRCQGEWRKIGGGWVCTDPKSK